MLLATYHSSLITCYWLTCDPGEPLRAFFDRLKCKAVVQRLKLKPSRAKQALDDLGGIRTLDMRFIEARITALIIAGKTAQNHGRTFGRWIEVALCQLNQAGLLDHLTRAPIVFQKRARI